MNIKPKNPLLRIKYLYLEWCWDRALRRSGCSSWEQYFRVNDPDYYAPGRTVRDQLRGYPYVALVPYQHLDCNIDPMWGPLWSGSTVEEWCRENCAGKYRWHWERVTMDHYGQYHPNGIGGTDELFFGFKNEHDCTMFLLRWS